MNLPGWTAQGIDKEFHENALKAQFPKSSKPCDVLTIKEAQALLNDKKYAFFYTIEDHARTEINKISAVRNGFDVFMNEEKIINCDTKNQVVVFAQHSTDYEWLSFMEAN